VAEEGVAYKEEAWGKEVGGKPQEAVEVFPQKGAKEGGGEEEGGQEEEAHRAYEGGVGLEVAVGFDGGLPLGHRRHYIKLRRGPGHGEGWGRL
jgi:hypothetical protein